MRNQSQKIRKAFLLLHRWLGLTTGLVVFIVALTGCLYVFEEEWRELFHHKYLHVADTSGQRKTLTELTAAVKNAYPQEAITQVRFLEEKDAAFVFLTKNELAISVNPYTGEITGQRNMKKDFMNVVLDIHLDLLLGEAGKQIVRWNVLIFFVICITGLVLWWPKQKCFFKQAVSIKWRAKSWKRVNWDLHSVLGFYALAVLLIISLTGIFWVFDTAKNMVSLATGSPVWQAPKLKSTPAFLRKADPLDHAYAAAKFSHPGARQVLITVPKDSVEPIRILFRYPYTIIRKQTTLWFDQYSLANMRTDAYQNYTRYEKVSRSIYDFHTGRIRALGIGSKIIYFLASLFAASLPVTGFLIWWGRNKNKKQLLKKPVAVKEPGSPQLAHPHKKTWQFI
ncbi:MAG TPA: PepSY-associated TM helix domain-containing protein [Flavisolibacter sp.]|nr:PepSY-associated TM helix domain-containing protein [Flavisolibacter sp.]